MCDLCTEMPKPTDGGKTYTFKIRKDVKFHDGTPLTAKDVHASFQRIIFPPQGVSSARKAQFGMVESVDRAGRRDGGVQAQVSLGRLHPGARHALQLHLLEGEARQGPALVREERDGLGPLHLRGARGRRRRQGQAQSRTTTHAGKPYLDGFEAIFAKTQTLRVQAIRGDQAAIEFRGFPPKSRDDLVAALGKDITVQESDWNCVLLVHAQPQEEAVRRRARAPGALARGRPLGRVEGPVARSPSSRRSAASSSRAIRWRRTKEELEQIAGYWPDINKSRAEAKKLLQGGRRRRTSSSRSPTAASTSPTPSSAPG